MSGIIVDTHTWGKQRRYQNICFHGVYHLMGDKNKQNKLLSIWDSKK